MATNGSGLSSRQQRAVAALLASKSVAEAASTAGVGERTLYRWLAEDQAFRAALSQAEGDLLDTATRRLLTLQGKAIDALEHLIERAETEGVRLRAAQVAIDTSLKLREMRDIEQRLTALEQAQTG
jgi:hypothetical protein